MFIVREVLNFTFQKEWFLMKVFLLPKYELLIGKGIFKYSALGKGLN